MNFFKGLNKEQWTALGAAALSALMLLFGFGGGASGASAPKGGSEEPYNAQKPRTAELPDEKFERYWGRNPFRIESAVKLPVPPLKAPEPREEEMLAPLIRPHPAWEAYNALASAVKYPTLVSGQPIVAEANLPAASEVAELCKLQEPEVVTKADRRAERERQFAEIKLRAGSTIKALKAEKIGDLIVGKRENGTTLRIPAGDTVGEILQNRTNEEQYHYDSERIRPGAKEAEERLKLAERCLDLGMVPEAREELKKCLEARKDYLEGILAMGRLAVESSDFETAVATYRAGIEAGAPAGDLWFEIGRCLKQLSFNEGALLAFEKAVEAQPRLHAARIALARALVDAGQGQAAVESATDFFTKLGNAPDTTPQQRADAALVRGLAYIRVGQLDKARADFADCLKVDPTNAEAINGNGAALALAGEFPQAGPEFVKAIRANQYLSEAWTNLAALFLLGGKWAEAEQLATAAAQRDPASVEALLERGVAQFLAGNKDAPKAFDLAEKTGPSSLQVQMVTGLLRLREGQNEAALEKFVSALRRDFFFLPAYSAAAAAYLRAGRTLAEARDDASVKKADEMRVNAETLLRRILKVDPSRANAQAALGCAYAVMQRPDEAREALRKAKDLKAGDPLIYYAFGYLEYYNTAIDDVAKRLELARGMFEQAVKLEPTATDPFSQKVIADCKKAIDDIDLWGRTSLRLLETFDGPDSKSIGSNWLERENQGIQITRENSKERGGRAKFAGKQAVRDFALTSLMHEVPGADFYSFEITFFPEKVEKAEFGLSIFHTVQGTLHSGISVGFDGTTGKARFHANSSDNDLDIHDMAVGWQEIKVPVPNPKEIKVRVTLTEAKNRARVFTVFFWDPAKSDWISATPPVTVNPPRGAWQVGAWVHSWKDHEVLLYVDNIQVLEQARR
jgi:tetratricopeptide (TPR) repeat protein